MKSVRSVVLVYKSGKPARNFTVLPPPPPPIMQYFPKKTTPYTIHYTIVYLI